MRYTGAIHAIRGMIFLMALLGFCNGGQAKLTLEVTQGNVSPMPVALLDFSGKMAREQAIGKEISQIIQQDLAQTGLFNFINPKACLEKQLNLDVLPQWSAWRILKVQALINGAVTIQGDKITVKFRLWDIFAQEAMITSSLGTDRKHLRRIAHIIADFIYERITGEKGYFDTRVVYIAESGPFSARQKRLAIMDQDGHNHQYLTDGKDLVLTPRFSPNVQKVVYLSYTSKVPKVYVLDLETGKQELVGQFPGMTFAPRFAPKGNKVIMSQALGGNSDIYTMDLTTRLVSRLTTGSNINTSPCYDPTGEKITFNSDRGGSKQLYIMDADGKNVKRISFGSGVYSTPVWSPRGDWIAFTKTQDGQFYIGVMRPNGTGERLISTGFIVEGPTWAPNGRTILFTRQDKSDGNVSGKARVIAIDITGENERELKTPGDGSDPAWSPPLPKA